MTSFDDRGYLQPAVRKDKTAPSRAFQKRSTELRCEPLRGYRKQEATPTGCCPFVVCLLLLLLLVLLVLRLDVAVAHCCLLLFSFAAFLFAFNDNATALCVYATATANPAAPFGPSSRILGLIPLAKRPDTLSTRPPFVIRSTTIMVCISRSSGGHKGVSGCRRTMGGVGGAASQSRMPHHCQCIKC